jgi:hypothetical protein
MCPNCGGRVEAPPEHRRNKMRCPYCGTICELPRAEERSAVSSVASVQAAEETAEQLLSEMVREDRPSPTPVQTAPAPEPIRKKPKRRRKCPQCGERLNPDAAGQGRGQTCPVCAWSSAEQAIQAQPKLRVVAPTTITASPTSRPAPDKERESYEVAAGQGQDCPSCRQPLPEGAVVCVACGLELQSGAKLTREFKPLRYQWEWGLAPANRVFLLVFCQVVVLLLGLQPVFAEGDLWEFPLAVWLMSGALLAFVLGTFPTMDFSRDRRGRVQLLKTWRIGFIYCKPIEIPIQSFEGISRGKEYQSGVFPWLITIILLFYGILPGVLWWYFVIYKDLFYVALCRDHGFPEQYVYRGKNEERVQEIAKILGDVFRT